MRNESWKVSMPSALWCRFRKNAIVREKHVVSIRENLWSSWYQPNAFLRKAEKYLSQEEIDPRHFSFATFWKESHKRSNIAVKHILIFDSFIYFSSIWHFRVMSALESTQIPNHRIQVTVSDINHWDWLTNDFREIWMVRVWCNCEIIHKLVRIHDLYP
jgi:hypothetical protein